MIEKIRPVADDVNVAVRKVYGKANDAYAYYDSACKNKVTCAELQDSVSSSGTVSVDKSNNHLYG